MTKKRAHMTKNEHKIIEKLTAERPLKRPKHRRGDNIGLLYFVDEVAQSGRNVPAYHQTR
jgi:hypothetical protein